MCGQSELPTPPEARVLPRALCFCAKNLEGSAVKVECANPRSKLERNYRTRYLSTMLFRAPQKQLREKLDRVPQRLDLSRSPMIGTVPSRSGLVSAHRAGQGLWLQCTELGELEFLPWGKRL
jgi:hypothetical protein